MEQSPSLEANRFSARQELSHILCNPKVHYRIHKCLPPVPILGQINPVHIPTFHFLIIHLIIILPSKPESSKLTFLLRFTHQNPVHTSPLLHTCYIPLPHHCFRFITHTAFGENYIQFWWQCYWYIIYISVWNWCSFYALYCTWKLLHISAFAFTTPGTYATWIFRFVPVNLLHTCVSWYTPYIWQ